MSCGNNVGVAQNAATSERSLLKKKRVAMLHHKMREAAAAGIARPAEVGGDDNFDEALTEAQALKRFCTLTGGFMRGRAQHERSAGVGSFNASHKRDSRTCFDNPRSSKDSKGNWGPFRVIFAPVMLRI